MNVIYSILQSIHLAWLSVRRHLWQSKSNDGPGLVEVVLNCYRCRKSWVRFPARSNRVECHHGRDISLELRCPGAKSRWWRSPLVFKEDPGLFLFVFVVCFTLFQVRGIYKSFLRSRQHLTFCHKMATNPEQLVREFDVTKEAGRGSISRIVRSPWQHILWFFRINIYSKICALLKISKFNPWYLGMQIRKKSNLHFIRGITPNRATRGGSTSEN